MKVQTISRDAVDWIEDVGVEGVRMKWNFQGIISHITQRASGAAQALHEEQDYLEMLVRLKGVCQAYQLDVFPFAVMSTHFLCGAQHK